MNKKRTTKIIISSIIIIITLTVCILLFVNYSKDDKSLSILEKKWVTNNINNVVSVNVFNDIPVYGYNGNGIIFDFLNKFTDEYGIRFNKISYFSMDKINSGDLAFFVRDAFSKLDDHDILLYEDDYVILSKDDVNISNLNAINEDNIGVLENDYDLVYEYLNSNDNILKYNSSNLLMEAIKDDNIKYVIVPNMMFMDNILSNNLNIVYHLSDLDKKYVLYAKDSTVYSIMNKYYARFLDNDFDKSYSRNYLNAYFTSSNTSSLEQKNYNAKVYKYGYAVNMPYENNVDGSFVGVISNYLKDFETVTGAEISTIKYNSIDEVKNALVSGDIDFALTNFSYDNINLDKYLTSAFLNEDYVVLAKNNININSIKGLRNNDVLVVGSSNLYNLCVNNKVSPVIFKNSDDLLRNINDDSIILLDKNTYLYYKDAKLSGYKIVYENSVNNGYRFIINNDNNTFAKLFNYYISSNSYDNIKYRYNTNISLNEGNYNIIFIIFIILFIICLIYLAFYFSKSRELINNINKDDKSRFIDPMTSLKNRNYLNHNIYNWDDNVIFPQSVIVLDINKLRNINDKFGREIGDEVVKKVASVLIDNQVENTDIIRSGGDEFLIYMVGYDEKYTVEYAKKITKLMNDIEHSLGVTYGYSMIYDEVKTIDDAINESVNMMTKNKNVE